MQELSMNILDVAENAVAAGATLIAIALEQDTAAMRQTLRIEDNGRGMDAATVQKVTDPFYTTRTTRDVGLGLPFLKMAAEMTGGALAIESTPGKGTCVSASYGLGHIDLMPLGDMGGTVAALVQARPDIDIDFSFCRDGAVFRFTTAEAREILGGVSLGEAAVAQFIKSYVDEGIEAARQAG
ncbi:MAG: sensor histidine kinase [Oscillospiraceae bacterium]